MYFQNIIRTLFSKSIILVLSFFTVLISTNLWGAEGRGIISLLLANMAIITIFNNILGGSCIIYLTPKIGFSKLILQAFIWIFISTLIGSIIFYVCKQTSNPYFLFFITFFNSIITVGLMAFVGKENLKAFNIYSALIPALLIIIVVIIYFIFKIRTINIYFYSYILALVLVFIISSGQLKRYVRKQEIGYSQDIFKSAINFGWKNELSYFMQFLNYRLTYYFILFYYDFSSLGVYSVGIAISESVWVISKSIATVQYSKMVNTRDRTEALELTKKSALISLIASVFIIGILLLIPNIIYEHIFGRDFTKVKYYFLLLAPGVLLIAFSNIYGHYFSAYNKLGVLIIKSVIGLVITITMCFYLIPRWGIKGACVATSLSYIFSSVYLIIQFYREYQKNKFIFE